MPGNRAVDDIFEALRIERDIKDLCKETDDGYTVGKPLNNSNHPTMSSSFIEMDSQELSILCRSILDISIPYHTQKNLEDKIKCLRQGAIYDKKCYDEASWWSRKFGRFENKNPYNEWNFDNEKEFDEQLLSKAKVYSYKDISFKTKMDSCKATANRLLAAAKYSSRIMVSSYEIHELNCWKIDDEVQTYRK